MSTIPDTTAFSLARGDTATDLGTDAERYRDIAERAVELLLSVGCYGLDRSKERELWQRGLDLQHELNPASPRQVVWTTEAAGEGEHP